MQFFSCFSDLISYCSCLPHSAPATLAFPWCVEQTQLMCTLRLLHMVLPLPGALTYVTTQFQCLFSVKHSLIPKSVWLNPWDRESWHATVQGSQRVRYDLETKQQQLTPQIPTPSPFRASGFCLLFACLFLLLDRTSWSTGTLSG